jgi:beta-carotene 15,15'-dioxygenase
VSEAEDDGLARTSSFHTWGSAIFGRQKTQAVTVPNVASTPVGSGHEQDARRSFIGCCACGLLAAACVVDRGRGGLDLFDWAGPSACLLLVVGVPHGALDIELLRNGKHNLGDLALVFCVLGYVGLVLVTLGIWWIFPGLALIVFLALSAYHFGGDWTGLERTSERTLVGAALLAAPAAMHAESVTFIFSWLVSSQTAGAISKVLHWISARLVLGVCAVVAARAQQYRAQCEEIGVIVVAALTLPPLTFFVIYFCALHSVRHLVDVRRDLAT